MKKNYNLNINGPVQGVGFRYSAMHKARELGITGFIKNKYDGSVYIEVEGEEAVLMSFIKWCKSGPSWSRVDKIDVNEGSLVGFREFVVK